MSYKKTPEQCRRYREAARARDPEGYRRRKREANKRWKAKNPEKFRAMMRKAAHKFYTNNRATISLQSKERWQRLSPKQKDRIRQLQRAWRAKCPPERLRQYEDTRKAKNAWRNEKMKEHGLLVSRWRSYARDEVSV